MPINVTCPSCAQTLRVPDRFIGIRVKCKFCQQSILVEVQEDPPPSAPGLETMNLPADNVFEQQTMAGPAPQPAPAPSGGASVFEKRTLAPAAGASAFERKTAATAPPQNLLDPPDPEPVEEGPPPLPPRPPGPAKLKIGALFVSLLSLAVICGSVAGIIVLRQPAEVPPPPVVGEKYAVIALESGGIRFVIAPIEKTSGGGYKLGDLTLENREIPLAPKKGEKELDPANVSQALKEVGKFVLTAKQNEVAEDHLFVVCNSGVLRDFASDAALLGKAKAALEAGVREAGGGTLIFVEADDEARFGALGCVPPEDRTGAVLLDLGSSSVRCGYHEADGSFTGFDLPLGRRKFSEAVNTKVAEQKAKLPFAVVAEQMRPGLLNDPLKKTDRPAMVNRKKYHLIGGGAWVPAVLTHPGELRRVRVALKEEDMRKFDLLVSDPAQTLPGLQAQAKNKIQGLPDRDRKLAEDEITAVGDRFKKIDDLVVMAKVLRAFADECDFKSKDVRFFTNGLYAWPLGFLLARSGVEK